MTPTEPTKSLEERAEEWAEKEWPRPRKGSVFTPQMAYEFGLCNGAGQKGFIAGAQAATPTAGMPSDERLYAMMSEFMSVVPTDNPRTVGDAMKLIGEKILSLLYAVRAECQSESDRKQGEAFEAAKQKDWTLGGHADLYPTFAAFRAQGEKG